MISQLPLARAVIWAAIAGAGTASVSLPTRFRRPGCRGASAVIVGAVIAWW